METEKIKKLKEKAEKDLLEAKKQLGQIHNQYVLDLKEIRRASEIN